MLGGLLTRYAAECALDRMNQLDHVQDILRNPSYRHKAHSFLKKRPELANIG